MQHVQTWLFFIALICTLLAIIRPTLSRISMSSKYVGTVIRLLANLCFLLVIILWYRVLKSVGLSVRQDTVKGGVHIGLHHKAFVAAAIAALVISILDVFVPYLKAYFRLDQDLHQVLSGEAQQSARLVLVTSLSIALKVIYLPMLAITSVGFLTYTVMFVRGGRMNGSVPETRRTLYRLSALAGFGMISCLLQTISVVFLANRASLLNDRPYRVTTQFLIRTLTDTVRCVGLIVLLRLERSALPDATEEAADDMETDTVFGDETEPSRAPKRSSVASKKYAV